MHPYGLLLAALAPLYSLATRSLDDRTRAGLMVEISLGTTSRGDGMTGDKLEKLLEQRKTLNARIQQEINRENRRKRKDDTRRKILVGAAVLDDAEKHPKHKEQLYKLLGRFLVRPNDRELFGLDTEAGNQRTEGRKDGGETG